jgi:hypothetical protein
MVAEIERLAELRKRPARTPLWHGPARWALRRWLAGRVDSEEDAAVPLFARDGMGLERVADG